MSRRRARPADGRASATDAEFAVCSTRKAKVHVVVGGFAVALHGAVRTTKDIDILIESPRSRTRSARAGRPGRVAVGGCLGSWTSVVVARKVITIVGDDPRVDIPDARLERALRGRRAQGHYEVEVDDVVIPFADLDTLIRSKRTGQAQDQADVEVLEQIKHLGP